MHGEGAPISCTDPSRKASSHVSKNRQILKAILKTIVFCSRQNIALRWHNESSKSGHIPGNFRALLEFMSMLVMCF